MVIRKLGNVAVAKCPHCGRRIELGTRSRRGRILSCPHCDAVLELVNEDPPLIDWVYPELGSRKTSTSKPRENNETGQ